MEETVLLNFEVDQGKAERSLEKIEGLILDNKKAQQDLTKALKAGTITQEEYVKENIRLQGNLKKEQDQKKTLVKLIETESNSRNALRSRISQLVKEYDNLNLKSDQGAKRAKALQVELTKLNNELTKGDKAAGLFKNQIGNYPQQFAQAASGIKIAGVSVGEMGSKLTSFLNPATAVVGILAGLATAYATSTVGARDLQKATDTLAGGFQLAQESYAEFIDELGSSNNRGILEQSSSAINRLLFGTGVANAADALAAAKEVLRNLEISRAFAAGDSKKDERRAELARRERDDEKKSLEERIAASLVIDDLLDRSVVLNEKGEKSLSRTSIIIQAQIEAIKRSTINYDLNRLAQLEVAKLTSEIEEKEEEITGKLTENVTAREKLLQLQREAAELANFEAREASKPLVNLGENAAVDILGNADKELTGQIIEGSQFRRDIYLEEIDVIQQTEEQKREIYRQSFALKQKLDEEQTKILINELDKGVNNVRNAFGEQSTIYKLAASVQALVATYSSATKSYDALSGIPYVGPELGIAAAAAAIASGLANVAAINGIDAEFADGGWTGPGKKYDAVGVVHADEYVVPKHINNAPQAQPHLQALERMRSGYADGGFVTNTNTAPAQQSLIMANAFKNLPTPQVSVVEVTRAQNRIQARERVSTLGR